MSTPPIPDSAVLRAEDLGRKVNDKAILSNISFELHAGDVLAIAGRSGSGKSSLLRLLNRLDEPTSGTVYLEETDYRQIEPRTLRCKVGMVTQRPFLFPGTVEENLRYGPAQRGNALSTEDAAKLLVKVGLQDYALRNVANLSGGEAQRVSVARTLANSPLVLLLDEPTSSLDEASKLGIESLLKDIVREQQLTYVIVTHDWAQAVRLANRALILEGGRITLAGAVNEILHA